MVILLTTLLLLSFPPIAASADIIFEPPDSFYKKHYADCVNINRNFYANGKDGYIMLKSEPGASGEVAAFVNGTIFNISFAYDRNGEQWGVVTFYAAADSAGQNNGTRVNEGTGWIPMSDLVVVYDYISFEEEYGSEFYSYSGDSYDGLSENIELVFWTWPGSGEIAETHRISHATNYTESERIWLTTERAYKDAEGREWGFVPYYYAARNRWICLSDPANADIPAFNPAPEPQLWPPIDPGSLPSPRSGAPTLIIIITMVAAVTIGTAVLIKILWKPAR